MICENCGKEHNGKYGSGRFCNFKCARGFSTKAKRKDINKQVSKKLKGYRTILGGKIKLCDYGCGKEAKFKMTNGNWCCEDYYTKCPNLKKKNYNGIKNSNYKRKGFPKWACLKGNETNRKNLRKIYDILPFEEKTLAEQYRIVLKEQDNKCLICGIKDWNDKLIVLHLDHIDGNNQNQERENLRYICPNCHSQTSTYCGRNLNISKGNMKVSEKDLIKSIKTSKNISQALTKCGLVAKGGNYARVRRLIKENNL